MLSLARRTSFVPSAGDSRAVTRSRVAAAVFLCPDGSGLYPAYAGFDQDLQAVAVLVDLKLL